MTEPNTPYLDLLPPLSTAEREALRADIVANGQRVPIMLMSTPDGDVVIDGHHRLAICRELGLVPLTTYVEDDWPEALAIRMNVNRRNLSSEQHAELRKHQKKLANRMVADGMTQEQVAVVVGVDRTTVLRWIDFSNVQAHNTKPDLPKGPGAPVVAVRIPKSEYSVIYDRYEAGERQADIAADYKVTIARISQICSKELARRDRAAAVAGAAGIDTAQPQAGKPTKSGEWYELGPHLLYCGDSASDEFQARLEPARLAFADPPYNAGADHWDHDFKWRHDYLADTADLVIVTPGISAIMDFARVTTMPYKWSLAAHITNGMTRGAVGFGNWIYCALFSHGSVFAGAQDHYTTSVGSHPGAEHKGRKPAELMAWLVETFTEPDDLVIDPFAGSGTTLLVADRLGRRCITAEIDLISCGNLIAAYEGRDWA